jgi:hypothetical protein
MERLAETNTSRKWQDGLPQTLEFGQMVRSFLGVDKSQDHSSPKAMPNFHQGIWHPQAAPTGAES